MGENESTAASLAEIGDRAERRAEKRAAHAARVATLGAALVEVTWVLADRLDVGVRAAAEYVDALESSARRLAILAGELDVDRD